MKTLFTILFIAIVAVSCNTNNTEAETSTTDTTCCKTDTTVMTVDSTTVDSSKAQ